jgi:catechol 2,3-dioxygenase-like lactoylglutathione lyase family enzyme
LTLDRPKFTHLALHVPDVEQCVSFYERHCGLEVVHRRAAGVVWLGEPGKRLDFVIVLVPGGESRSPRAGDFTHFGFALETREAVDRAAERARLDGCLCWEPREEPYPVGYYCGLVDPAGHVVELSYGQPLGPGAPELPEAPANSAPM